jgi:hypothetical protein
VLDLAPLDLGEDGGQTTCWICRRSISARTAEKASRFPWMSLTMANMARRR